MIQDKSSEINKRVGAWLKASRLKSGYGIQEVAEAVGVSRNLFKGWESGQASVPLWVVMALARLYGNDMLEIMDLLEMVKSVGR